MTENTLIVVLTGGPCGGKTSALAFLRSHLKNHPVYKDFDVFTVCESATLIGNCGPGYPGLSEERRAELDNFEEQLMKLQIQLEDTIFNIAKFPRGKKTIIFCDRGTLDLKPYMPSNSWQTLLRNTGLNEESLNRRYHAVIHMVSVAIGAESFYSSESNSVRIESCEEAKALDDLTFESWQNHTSLHRIDNSGSGGFPEKLKKLLQVFHSIADTHFRIE